MGFSLPTYWPQDGINNAAENARGKLALAMTSHVEYLGMDTATANHQGGATANIVSGAHIVLIVAPPPLSVLI